MRRRQAMPTVWLMTDERAGGALAPGLLRLPRGSGIVFRHYRTAPAERRALFRCVRSVARRRGLVLVLAGDVRTAIAWRADGVHGATRRARHGLFHTMPAHGRRDLIRAACLGADLAFLSPVFSTRSHPGAPGLGPVRFGLAAAAPRLPVVALGGMDARRMRRLRPLGAWGWAGIDAWSGDDQKRKVVPR